MKQRDRDRCQEISDGLERHSSSKRSMPGVSDPAHRDVLARQMVESERRVRFPKALLARDVDPRRTDPHSDLFEPIRASIHHQRQGALDEACWTVFWFVHFGRHARGGYRYLSDTYGRLGSTPTWTWDVTSADPAAFTTWLAAHAAQIKGSTAPGGFGNHRKYEKLEQTGQVVETYVAWVGPGRSHQALIDSATDEAGNDRRQAFDVLYQSMSAVWRFGRTARFDYLAMLGKLDLAPIEPGSTYLTGSTGPYAGARILYGPAAVAKASNAQVDGWLVELADDLGIGMQEMEDSVCNWQKSPGKFKAFRG